MSIQGVFNDGVTKQTSIWLSAAFVQLSAFIFCAAAWFLTGRESNIGALFKIENKYMLLGGVIGAIITYTVIKSIGALGPGEGILIIVTSQLLVAYLIEVFGIFGVEKAGLQWQKLMGIIIAIAGIFLFNKK